MTYRYEQVKTKLINAYTNIFEQMFNPAAGISPAQIHALLIFMFKEESTLTLGMRLVTLTKTIPIELENYEELKQVLIDEVPRIVDGYLWAKKYSPYSPALNERIFKHEAHYKFTKICEMVGLDIETLFDVNPGVESNYDWVNESQEVPQQSRAFTDIIISTFSQEFTKWLDTVLQQIVHTRTYQGPAAILHKNLQYVKVLKLLERICPLIVDIRGDYIKSPYTPNTIDYMIDKIHIFQGSQLLVNRYNGVVSYDFTYNETDETTYEVIAMRNDTTSLERIVAHAAKGVLRHFQTAVLQQDLEDIEEAINMLIHRESHRLSIKAIEFHFLNKLPELVDTTSTDLENNEDAVVVYLTQWLDTIFTDAVSVPEPQLTYAFNRIFDVLNERFHVGAYVYDRDSTAAATKRFIDIYIIGKDRIELEYPHPRTGAMTQDGYAKKVKGMVQEIEAALNPFYPLFAKRIYDFMIDKYGKFDYDVFVKALPSELRPATPFGADTISYDWANESYKQRIDADLIIGNIIELLDDIVEAEARLRISIRPTVLSIHILRIFGDICSVFKVPASFKIEQTDNGFFYRIDFNGDETIIDYYSLDDTSRVRNFLEQHYELIATSIYNYMLDKYGRLSQANLIKAFKRALPKGLVNTLVLATVAKTDVTKVEHGTYDWVNESYEQMADTDFIIGNIIELLYDIVEVKAHTQTIRPSTYFNLFEDICYVFKVPASFETIVLANELAYRVSFKGDEIKIDYDDNILTVRNFFEQYYELIARSIYNYMLDKYGHFSHTDLIKEFRRALTEGLVNDTVAKTDVTKVERSTYDWANESYEQVINADLIIGNIIELLYDIVEARARTQTIRPSTYFNLFEDICYVFKVPASFKINHPFKHGYYHVNFNGDEMIIDYDDDISRVSNFFERHYELIATCIYNYMLDKYGRLSQVDLIKEFKRVLIEELVDETVAKTDVTKAEHSTYDWANESATFPKTEAAAKEYYIKELTTIYTNAFKQILNPFNADITNIIAVFNELKNIISIPKYDESTDEISVNGETFRVYHKHAEAINEDIMNNIPRYIEETLEYFEGFSGIVKIYTDERYFKSIPNMIAKRLGRVLDIPYKELRTAQTERSDYTWVNESQEVELMDLHRNFIALWLDEVFADYHERNRIDSVELLLKDLNVAFNTAITASSRNKFASYVVTVWVSAHNRASFEIPVVSLKDAFNYAKPYLVEKIYQHVTLVSEDGNFSVDAFNEIAASYHLPPLALTEQKYDWVNESQNIPDHRTVNAILDWMHDQRGLRDADGSLFIALAFVNRLDTIFNTGVTCNTDDDEPLKVHDGDQVIYRHYLNIKDNLDNILLLVAHRIYERIVALSGTNTFMVQIFNELLQKYHDKHYIATTSKLVLNTPSTDYTWANENAEVTAGSEALSARTQYRNSLKVALTEWLTEMIRINQEGAPKTVNRKMVELIQLFWTISWAGLPLEFVPVDADRIGDVPVGLKLNYLHGKKIYCILGEGPDTGYYTSGANADNIYVNLEEETTVLFEIAQALIPYTVDVILTEWDEKPALTIVKTINRVEYLIKESAYLTKVPEFNHPPEPQSEDYSPVEENEIKVQLIGWLQDVYDGYRKKLEYNEALEFLNQKMRAVFKTGIYLQRLDTKLSDNYAYTAGFSGRSNDNYYFELTEANEEEVLFEFLKHVANRIYEANVEITEDEFNVEYFNRMAGASGFPPLKSVVSKDYQWASEAINNVEKYKGNN